MEGVPLQVQQGAGGHSDRAQPRNSQPDAPGERGDRPGFERSAQARLGDADRRSSPCAGGQGRRWKLPAHSALQGCQADTLRDCLQQLPDRAARERPVRDHAEAWDARTVRQPQRTSRRSHRLGTSLPASFEASPSAVRSRVRRSEHSMDKPTRHVFNAVQVERKPHMAAGLRHRTCR